jgi:hypothetical protein
VEGVKMTPKVVPVFMAGMVTAGIVARIRPGPGGCPGHGSLRWPGLPVAALTAINRQGCTVHR